MEANYKFYLSFENSVCEDYVTEKYYNVMKYNVIPVTYNGANMSLYGPPHAFINSLDYESAEALVAYLHEVSNLHVNFPPSRFHSCELCQSLNTHEPV